MKFDIVLKQFKLNILLNTILRLIFKAENCDFYKTDF